MVEFEPDFQMKILYQKFENGVEIRSKEDVLKWRSEWTEALASWHSPYKTIIDMSSVKVEWTDSVIKEVNLTLKFFSGLFMKKAVGFGVIGSGEGLNLQLFKDAKLASEAIGIRERKLKTGESKGLRESLTITNDFKGHVLEVSCESLQLIATKDDFDIFKTKITNNLMQWHSKWTLLIDISNFTIKDELFPDFEKAMKLFHNFFMKDVIGYGVNGKQKQWPFKVYRSRHKAAAQIERDGNFSADKAHCRSGSAAEEDKKDKDEKKDKNKTSGFKIHRG